ncbi:MAG: CotH kinase family protein, partial [Planctomycetota bacterium]
MGAQAPPGNLNTDWVVDWEDLRLFTLQWLDPYTGCFGQSDCADFDDANGVNIADYALLAGNWFLEGSMSLVINEVLADNDSKGTDPYDDHHDDWIEIHNYGLFPIDIGGMWMADSSNIWPIPTNAPSETTIDPNSYVLIWADEEPWQGPLHVNFKLSKNGDTVKLYGVEGPFGTPIDSITFDDDDQDTDKSYGRYPNATGDWWLMKRPSPGRKNRVGMSPEPMFSHPAGTFSTPFSLGLSASSPDAEIYYQKPGMPITLYTGTPISITETVEVRARTEEPNLFPGNFVSQTYIALDPDVQNFNSNLPIVVIDSRGWDIDAEGENESRPYRWVAMNFIETDETTSRANITDTPDWAGPGAMHVRGSSSASYEKKQYKFETRDKNSWIEDDDISLLGLPAHSDWILLGPYSDKTLMRNYQMYTWNQLTGRYGVGCVFVEAFIDYDGDGFVEWDGGGYGSDTDYRGVYVLMEQIKRGRGRIDIERLEVVDVNEPEVTGGYILEKSDGSDPYTGFETDIYGDGHGYVYPNRQNIVQGQKDWIKDYFDEFEEVLADDVNYTDPVNGYARYIDIGSFIDHHMLVEIAKNVDGFLISTYLFKDRGGKINMGPIWDYNGSLGGADYVCNWDPVGWLYEAHDEDCCIDGCCVWDSCWRYRLADGGCEGDDLPNHYAWYERLFEDSEFLLKYADRWFELREDVFSDASMLGDIDNNKNLLTDNGAGDNPVDRNFVRWD